MTERSEHFAADLRSVRSGRHFVRDILLEWDLEQLVDDASLCVSEVVTNAVKHAGTELTIVVRRDDTDGVVVVDVHDGMPDVELRADPSTLDATSGRGLHIVATISQDWGVRHVEDGKVIWFRLPLPATGSRSSDADVFSMDARRGPEEQAPDGAGDDVRFAGGEQARHAG